MSSSPKFFYTIEPMSAIKNIAVTSEAVGFPIENALDQNPDTYWKPTSTANQTIDFDLGSAQQVDGLIVWIRNNDVSHANGALSRLQLSHSPDDITYTLAGSTAFINQASVPIFFHNTGLTSQAKRYWRIEFTSMNTTVEISQFFLYRSRNITANSQWPQKDARIYSDKQVKAPGGRKLTAGINGSYYERIEREFLLSGTVDFTTLQSVFDAAKGRRYSFIFTEGGATTDAKLCRFIDDNFKENQIDYQLYAPKLRMETLPYIRAGETF